MGGNRHGLVDVTDHTEGGTEGREALTEKLIFDQNEEKLEQKSVVVQFEI
jgi:hypothetical protein